MPLPIPAISDTTQEQYDSLPLVSTAQQAYVAAFDLAQDEVGSMIGARSFVKNDLENRGTQKLPPEELNKLYPKMTSPFREEMSAYSAQMLADRDESKKLLEERVAAGPQDGWNKTKQFGVGMIAHAMDPLEFGVGAVAGWGVGALVSRGAFGMNLAVTQAVAKLPSTPIAARMAVGAVESAAGNFIENAASEVALAATIGQEGAGEYDVKQGLINLTVGTFFGMIPAIGGKALGYGIEKASYGVEGFFLERKLAKMLRDTSPEADRQLVTTTVAAASDNKVPNPERLVKQLAVETSIDPTNPLRGDYTFSPLTPGEAKKLYMVTGPDGWKSVGDDVGAGRQLTDDPLVAQATAQRALSDGAGQVVEIDQKDLNPFNLSQDLEATSPEVQAAFKEAFEAVGDDLTDSKFAPMGVHEMVDYLHGLKNEEINSDGHRILFERLKELGFDSTVHNGSNRMGFSHSEHNVVEIFDDAKLGEARNVEADPGARQDMPRSDDVEAARAEADGFETRWDFDAEKARADFDEADSVIVSDKFDESAVKEADEIVEEFIVQEKYEKLEPWQQDEVDAYIQLENKIEDQRTLIKAAAQCLLGN